MLSPKRVLDLAVVQTSNSEAVLSYTEVGDGEGNVAKIDLRFGRHPIQWGDSLVGASSSQILPLGDSAIGKKREVVVLLDAKGPLGPEGAKTDFQTISYRGNLRTADNQFPDPPATFPDVGDDGERLGNVATLTIEHFEEPEEPPDVVVVGEVEITGKQVVDQTGQKWETINVSPRLKTVWGTFQLKLAKEID